MRGGKKNKGPGIGREINMKQRHCLWPRVAPMPGAARNCGRKVGGLEDNRG